VGFCPNCCGDWRWIGSLYGSIERICTHKDDDLALLITGKFSSTVSEPIKRVLIIVQGWYGAGHGAICQSL
jgi:hypothetical protein